MKILYDISSLRNNRMPAGMLLSIQQLLLGLYAHEDCDITLTASWTRGLNIFHDGIQVPEKLFGSLFDLAANMHGGTYCIEYWQSHPVISQIPFPSANIVCELNRLVRVLGWLHKKNLRKLLCIFYLLPYLNNLKQRSSVHKNISGQFDIYHQPNHEPPDIYELNRSICRFVNVHDMIPAKFPHYLASKKRDCKRFHQFISTLRKNDFVICPSKNTSDDFCQLTKHAPERVFVIPWGADDNLFFPCTEQSVIHSVKAKYSIPNGRYILCVCTLEIRKNLAAAIRNFARLLRQEKVTDLYLVIVGALGWQTEAMENALRDCQDVSHRIIFTGYIEDQCLSALYSGAIFFLYPSFYEGFGLPILESMQCGTPVITSNTSSLPEIVGDSGLLIDPHDDESIFQSMKKLLVDSELRTALSRAAINRANMFSWSKCIAQTIDAYKLALELSQ